MTSNPKEALERLKKFAGPAPYTGKSGYDIYPGGIFCKDGPNEFYADIRTLIAEREGLEREVAKPLKMLLFCPKCGIQHVDAPDERTPDWTNPPHRSHLCHACGCIWRPADVPTEGVAAIETKGSADTWSALSVAPPSQVHAEYVRQQGYDAGWKAGLAEGRAQPHPDVSGLVGAARQAKRQFEFYVEQHMGKQPPDIAKAKTNERFADLLHEALAALQSHKGGEGDSELAAADNNHKADCTTSGGAG